LANALNTEISGRTLFSGSATQTRPVDLTAAGFGGQTFTAPGPSIANTNYYQGNNFIQSVEAIDGFPVNYGVTADNSAFEKAIRAYDLIITNPNDPDTQAEALRLLQESADEMAVVQASLSQRAQTLDQQLEDNLEQLNLLDNQIVNIREVDVAEATVALKQLETQLEASYTVTATLLNLKLSDFIR
jgi:flagellar hook-associated protein 3 FlgL